MNIHQHTDIAITHSITLLVPQEPLSDSNMQMILSIPQARISSDISRNRGERYIPIQEEGVAALRDS